MQMILKAIMAIAKKINELVESETSEQAIKKKLLDLQIGLDSNEISPEQYDRLETELLEMLETARIQKEQEDNNYQGDGYGERGRDNYSDPR
jgi:hypothetical protein